MPSEDKIRKEDAEFKCQDCGEVNEYYATEDEEEGDGVKIYCPTCDVPTPQTLQE